jgi:transposase-like protein
MEIIFTPDPIFLKKLQGNKKTNIIQFPRREEVGDRFYQQQLEVLGDCPGNKNPKRRTRNVPWTDESKAQAIAMYEEQEPTPETSMEIVKEIADELNESPNGVRMILTKAGVYVKKTPAAKSSGGGGGTTTRVSKAAAVEDLTAAITDSGGEVDEDIVGKLTGKAAMYFAGLLRKH